MMGRRWTSVAIAGGLGLAVAGGGLVWHFQSAHRKGQAALTPTNSAAARSPMRTLADGIRQGDEQALAALCQRVLANTDQRPPALGEQEAADLVEVLEGLRTGFMKFSPVGRASAVAAATHILDRFTFDPAPPSWFETLTPIQALIIAGLTDAHVDVRASALAEVGRHWNWLPGRAMTPAEETTLAEWKDSFYPSAIKRLSDLEPKSRAAAVVCIGSLPIDSMARPAVANVEYPENGGVRYKALMTFSNRPGLLSVDTILKRLHDPEPGVPELAELILKGRGLSKDQIYLGRQMFNQKPEIRASVIPLLHERTDIDPDVWLIQLSHDEDETVRAKAVEALADRDSPEVVRRLREMASHDTSATIRAAAGKHVSKMAALPPLPGSTSLNPKAN